MLGKEQLRKIRLARHALARAVDYFGTQEFPGDKIPRRMAPSLDREMQGPRNASAHRGP